jgi:hypothetical protein
MIDVSKLSFTQMVKKINANDADIVFAQDVANWYVEQMQQLNWQFEQLNKLRIVKIVERSER